TLPSFAPGAWWSHHAGSEHLLHGDRRSLGELRHLAIISRPEVVARIRRVPRRDAGRLGDLHHDLGAACARISRCGERLHWRVPQVRRRLRDHPGAAGDRRRPSDGRRDERARGKDGNARGTRIGTAAAEAIVMISKRTMWVLLLIVAALMVGPLMFVKGD